MVIRLADRSNCYPKGFMKDVLVPDNELIFPADFSVFERKKELMPAKIASHAWTSISDNHRDEDRCP